MNKEYWKKWWKAALVRALRTMAQVACGSFTVDAAFFEVDWRRVVSVAIVSGIYSLLTSVSGLPEVEVDHDSE